MMSRAFVVWRTLLPNGATSADSRTLDNLPQGGERPGVKNDRSGAVTPLLVYRDFFVIAQRSPSEAVGCRGV